MRVFNGRLGQGLQGLLLLPFAGLFWGLRVWGLGFTIGFGFSVSGFYKGLRRKGFLKLMFVFLTSMP